LIRPRREKGEKEKRIEMEEEKKSEIRSRLVFWNVTGLTRKDEEFWSYICEYDFISLSETWIDEKGWDRMKG